MKTTEFVNEAISKHIEKVTAKFSAPINESLDEVAADVKNIISDIIHGRVAEYFSGLDDEYDHFTELSDKAQLKYILSQGVPGIQNLSFSGTTDSGEQGIQFTFEVNGKHYSGFWFPESGSYNCYVDTPQSLPEFNTSAANYAFNALVEDVGGYFNPNPYHNDVDPGVAKVRRAIAIRDIAKLLDKGDTATASKIAAAHGFNLPTRAPKHGATHQQLAKKYMKKMLFPGNVDEATNFFDAVINEEGPLDQSREGPDIRNLRSEYNSLMRDANRAKAEGRLMDAASYQDKAEKIKQQLKENATNSDFDTVRTIAQQLRKDVKNKFNKFGQLQKKKTTIVIKFNNQLSQEVKEFITSELTNADITFDIKENKLNYVATGPYTNTLVRIKYQDNSLKENATGKASLSAKLNDVRANIRFKKSCLGDPHANTKLLLADIQKLQQEYNDIIAQLKLNENATGGATGTSSVAVVTSSLGEKDSFSQKDVNKKLSGYGNMLTKGHKVTIKE